MPEDFWAEFARLASAGDVEGLRALMARVEADTRALRAEAARLKAENRRLRRALAELEDDDEGGPHGH